MGSSNVRPAPTRFLDGTNRIVLALVLAMVTVSPAAAEPASELIDKLLELSKTKKRIKLEKDAPEKQRLLVARYHLALEELQLRCQDFRSNLVTKEKVFEAGRNLLESELEVYSKPAEKARVLEKSIELFRWYEKRLEASLKAGLIPRADLLQLQYRRMSLELALMQLREGMKKSDQAEPSDPKKSAQKL